jgi:hypothetical protein
MTEPTTHRATRVGSRRILGDVGVQLGGQVVNIALGVVTTVVLVRALEATRYGEWATIMAVIELVAMVGNFGLETVAIRLAAQEPEREGAWVGAATSLRLAISVPALLVFIAVLTVVAADEQMLLAGLVLSLLYLTSVISTLRIIFRLHVRNHITVAFTTLNSVLWAGSVIAVAAAGGGIVAFAVAFIVTTIIVQGGLAVVALRTIHVRWRGSLELWPRLLGIGLSVGIAATLTFAYGRIDQILVYELAPDSEEVGIYAAMYKILDNAGFVPMAVMVTLFPIMAGLFPADPPRLRRMMQIAIDYLGFVALGGLALTIVAAEPIIELLYGSEFTSGATVLTVLIRLHPDLRRQRRRQHGRGDGPAAPLPLVGGAGAGAERGVEPGADPRVRDRGGRLGDAGDRGRGGRAGHRDGSAPNRDATLAAAPGAGLRRGGRGGAGGLGPAPGGRRRDRPDPGDDGALSRAAGPAARARPRAAETAGPQPG